jgi:hypothetical protein
VRATGVSGRFAYGFWSKLHFADAGGDDIPRAIASQMQQIMYQAYPGTEDKLE